MNSNIKSTDLNRWRLKVEHGRQTWHYLDNDDEIKNWPQSIVDKYWIGLPYFFKQLQTDDGHWAGEYGGPMFLIPGLIIAMYITHIPIPEVWRIEIIRYLVNKANPVDGGWGLHIEHHSTVFGTALNYVVLRILGLDPDHPVMVKSRATLHKLGGAIGVPSWGKFWLASLNVYDWEGLNPIPPELWLLPYFVPFHPGRFWIHTRVIYLPMGYCYGRRLSAEITPLIEQLRQELYIQPYETINWSKARNNIAEIDLYAPHTKLLKFCNYILNIYEKIPNLIGLRDISLQESYELIRCEDENTDYLDIAPVNKVLHILCTYYEEGPDSETFKLAKERLIDYMWLGPEGMMMCGTNGTQVWDTAFAAIAAIETGLADDPSNHQSMIHALEFLDDAQIKKNPKDSKRCYRDNTLGAWGFSTRDQGYNVSDCAAVGIKAVLSLQKKLNYTPELIPKERVCQTIDILLSMQNTDGGFASYERTRGFKILEWLNPAEVFGNIMVEYSYPECTSCVLAALNAFQKWYPDYRADEIKKIYKNAIKYLYDSQYEDGGWYGSWAICFTYATMFAIQCLESYGETYENSPVVKKGCDFLISKQKKDGGWGESYKSCETGTYVHHKTSQVVNTAWALLALMAGKYPNEEPIRRGIKLIASRQLPTGEWKQEAIEGVFNKNCAISYPNYKFIFTIWALGKYAKIYNNPVIL
ncbi:20617_t:CDS:10 [Dentiscutata erythropus]|uniref:Terpene cyclase/mutase family member n=1 Tax=Dentiscutata erythropus TaxID=1348616 RepID=A0A9N9AIP9_9GLOM|nr:20617_t:CDS:10 [Dentiscutata erythropus]